jgi:DNA-directed RNA polymerase specialized sigma24 family protein
MNEKKRHVVGINAVSIKDTDETMPSAEEIASADIAFAQLLKSLSTDRHRFIALCLSYGYSKSDIAFILNCGQDNIGHIVKRMQIKLIKYKIQYNRS